MKRRVPLALGMVAIVASAAGAIYVATGGDDGRPSEQDRALGLEHATVQMHLVLRRRLASGEGDVGARVTRAVESRDVAMALGRELYDARREGAEMLASGVEHGPVLTALGAPRREVATERASLLVAYLVAKGLHQDAASLPVVVYEASRLDPAALPESMRGMAEAARTLVYASGGHCELAAERASASGRGPSAEEVGGWLESVDAEVVAGDLEHARRLLIDGALACCALRAHDQSESARLIEATAQDARGLELAPEQVLVLQAFAATARGDRAAARELAGRIEPDTLSKVDEERLRMLRDALAGAPEGGLADAAVRLADHDWLLSAMLEAVVEVLERDGVLAALAEQPDARAARQLLSSEAELFSAARKTFLFFDQAHLERD